MRPFSVIVSCRCDIAMEFCIDWLFMPSPIIYTWKSYPSSFNLLAALISHSVRFSGDVRVSNMKLVCPCGRVSIVCFDFSIAFVRSIALYNTRMS